MGNYPYKIPPKLLPELVKDYNNGKSLAELVAELAVREPSIAITRQGLRDRLHKAGVILRPVGAPPL